MIDATKENFETVTVCGYPVLFTNARIDRDTVPESLFCYSVRHDDECQGDPVQIKENILVNHWGDVISYLPLPLEADGSLYLEEDDWNYEGASVKLAEYVANQKPFLSITKTLEKLVEANVLQKDPKDPNRILIYRTDMDEKIYGASEGWCSQNIYEVAGELCNDRENRQHFYDSLRETGVSVTIGKDGIEPTIVMTEAAKAKYGKTQEER